MDRGQCGRVTRDEEEDDGHRGYVCKYVVLFSNFFFFFLSQVLTSITRSKLGSPLNGMKVVHDNTCVDYRCAYSSQGTMEVGWGWTDILKSSEYLNFFTE